MDPPTSGLKAKARLERKNLLQGIHLDGLLEIGRSSAGNAETFGEWTPPEIEDLVGAFPAYELLEMIGRGGMGAVYRARHRSLDRPVAIKLLPPQACHEEAFVQRFHREARTLARLDHPGIVTVYDFGTTPGGLLYLVMEHVDGVPLSRLIQEGNLSVGQALEIVKQICDALACAHAEGIIHRDIKPANVLVDTKGRVNVVDFGLAKISTPGPEGFSTMHTQAGAILGTPAYAAPEQMKANASVDHRADIYSLGVMFYEMLTGDIPQGVFEPPSRKRQADQRLDQVVIRAMQEKPDLRYQKVTEMRDDVTRVQEDAEVPPRPNRGRPLLLAAFLVVGLGALAVAGLWFFRPASEPAEPTSPRVAAVPADNSWPRESPKETPVAERTRSGPAPLANKEAIYAGKRFLLIGEPARWEAAHARARELGGHLVSVDTAERNAWLATTFAADGAIFLGGQCGIPGGPWEWTDGRPWSYENWEGPPPIFGALRMNPGGKWTAGSFQDQLPYLIVLDEK